jgi:putative transposase
VRLARPGGARSILAESVFLKHQLLVLNRSRRRAPNLLPVDRLIAGLCGLLVVPRRLARCAIVVKPSTLLNLHRALIHRKYRLLFSPKLRAKPGPKGPSPDLIRAVVEMKQRNPRWGCPRIAEQIALVFGISINKDVVRRILAACGTGLHISDVSNRSRLRRFVHAVTDRAPKTTTTSVERCPAPKTCYTRTRSLL